MSPQDNPNALAFREKKWKMPDGRDKKAVKMPQDIVKKGGKFFESRLFLSYLKAN